MRASRPLRSGRLALAAALAGAVRRPWLLGGTLSELFALSEMRKLPRAASRKLGHSSVLQHGTRGYCSRCAMSGDPSIDANATANILVNLAAGGILVGLGIQVFGKRSLYPEADCLKGRKQPIDEAPPQSAKHIILQGSLYPPFPPDTEMAMFAFGCFWCSENIYMRIPRGIYSTAVGYSGGVTPNPTYEEVCSGQTNHAEVVRIVYRPSEISYEALMKKFWESHDPTTENRQGNDFGTPYRSAVYYYSEEQRRIAERTRDEFKTLLERRGWQDPITTQIQPAGEFYYAEGYHQQYDARSKSGYCGLRPTGVAFSEFEPTPEAE
eukprot:TRINITY_DN112668_c0_g1_i1.p1 TRINITY_DN112668_c0_g1~~TRINITY_DN112668_c0_g1_i1.p1  ORF type:complete len:333 (-),score=35.56 TRINITY_DN112668_c0_g1_i1:6-977(-)